jgi:hypothetical protein
MKKETPTTKQAVGKQASPILAQTDFLIRNCHLWALNNHEELTIIQR